jgi:hypothetical protein
MLALDDIRAAGEADLEEKLERLDARHRETLRAALLQYGRVQDIPETVWERIEREMADETAAMLLLLMMSGDIWTTDEIRRGGVGISSLPSQVDYMPIASARTAAMAAQTTDTLRNRLARRIEDAAISGPGKVGEVTPEGIDQALDDVLTKQRRETISIDQTTGSLSDGQRGAAERIGGDGARTDAGQAVTIELIWRTERDDRVCPRCSPLEGSNEETWGRVFPNGPGPEAHPNCRCWLSPQVIVDAATTESFREAEEGRWVTINGTPVKIDGDGVMLTGPLKGRDLDALKGGKSDGAVVNVPIDKRGGGSLDSQIDRWKRDKATADKADRKTAAKKRKTSKAIAVSLLLKHGDSVARAIADKRGLNLKDVKHQLGQWSKWEPDNLIKLMAQHGLHDETPE